MSEYLEFKKARCKDCYRCLRECPVKAIEVTDHQAKIIDERCILCGKCTNVCHQNAKHVHSETDEIKKLLSGGKKVIASVAPSFVSSFAVKDFSVMKIALLKLGFSDAEETAVGAYAVTREYEKLIRKGMYKNFITSACPAVDSMIQLYYPKALEFLAPVDSPMLAHAKLIREKNKDACVVFIGPCIAKKKEGRESGIIDGVMTFEELKALFDEKNISLDNIAALSLGDDYKNKARYYPINRGIIKSMEEYSGDYEYIAVDGAENCKNVLENIDSLSGVVLELNACEGGCINGPCSIYRAGGVVKANSDIREYARKQGAAALNVREDLNYNRIYPRLRDSSTPATERQIKEILAKTGKFQPEDELNCGACGYRTCREKAWAVINGYAEVEMCLPYMRERAESMSYEIIQNSPNGIVLVDNDLKISEINAKAASLLGISGNAKGEYLVEYMNPSDFVTALAEGKNVAGKRMHISKTDSYIELSVTLLKNDNQMFGVMKDITAGVNYNEKLNAVKMETLQTTDEVIKKQMRVAQEIASLLGETTAETKVALLKLKKTLQDGDKGEE